MRSIISRLGRLEASALPAVIGRFICLRGAEASPAAVASYLAGLGIVAGPDDMVLQDTPDDPGLSGDVAPGEPLSLVGVIPVSRSMEDTIGELH